MIRGNLASEQRSRKDEARKEEVEERRGRCILILEFREGGGGYYHGG